MDLYHLQEEAEPSDRTALESVVDYIKKEIEVRSGDTRTGAQSSSALVSLLQARLAVRSVSIAMPGCWSSQAAVETAARLNAWTGA